jgi:hypothetical protein
MGLIFDKNLFRKSINITVWTSADPIDHHEITRSFKGQQRMMPGTGTDNLRLVYHY